MLHYGVNQPVCVMTGGKVVLEHSRVLENNQKNIF